MEVEVEVEAEGAVGFCCVEESRVRSPRIHTWGDITARPPRMMCCVP